MKKRMGTLSAVLVLACGIIALYLYIDRSGKSAKDSGGTVAEQVLSRDLEKNYPPTPVALAEVYCEIVRGIYDGATTPEQLEKLVQMELLLFDQEFAQLNPYEKFLAATKEELAQAKEKKISSVDYQVDKGSNVEKWKAGSVEYASIRFELRSYTGGGRSTSSRQLAGKVSRKLTLRKDADRHYKILGWATEEDGGGDSADLSN